MEEKEVKEEETVPKSQSNEYPGPLQSVPANTPHDINKVQTGRPGMFSRSPTPPQHLHQPGMTGPAPSPQRNSLVQQPQQLNRQITLPSYFPRSNVPRTVPNMGRNPMPVGNQAAQQQASQYSHTVQMVQSHPMHPITPIIRNSPLSAQMYSQRSYNQAPYSLMYSYNRNNFNNAPPGSTNGYYQPHRLSSYTTMNTAQMPSRNTTTPQQAKKRIAIIDPKTCKDILQGVNDEIPVQKDESFEATESSTAGLQFATQVGVALCPEKKSDSSLKQPNLKHRRIAASFDFCREDLNSIDNVNESDSNNVNKICQPHVENVNIAISNDILSSEKNGDLNSINDSNKSRKNKPKKKKESNKKGKREESKETDTFLDKPIVLRYKENQWSPLNPEGKKMYDRDFLLQLQTQPNSLIKPRNLPNFKIIKDKAHIQKLAKVNRAALMPVLGGTPRPVHPTINHCDQQGGNDKKIKKFDFTVNLNETLQKPKLTVEEIRVKLSELLLSKENNEIIDWIDTHISSSAPGDVNFIHLLTYEVHKSALTHQIYKIYLRGAEKYELDQATLKTRIPLLNRYIDHNKNSELQTLYTIQQLMNELRHPKGVLRQIFYILYDDGVISEETFKKWEQSKDPDELEGKGVAMLSVRGFFTSLRDCESVEDN